MMKKPVNIAITGAAGQISYALLFRVAAGDLLGADQPVILHLLEVPEAMHALKGVVMELEDAAFPLLADIEVTDDAETAFRDADIVFLVGAKPRSAGMERRDLLQDNAHIFSRQGKALNAVARHDVRVLVIGNPANTNALIVQRNAPSLPPESFSAMSRLDHNRAVSQLAAHFDCGVADISHMTVWGNHSSTQFPDIHQLRIAGQPLVQPLDTVWYLRTFIPAVQQRGGEVLAARGKSSAASAAHAALCHMRDWVLGTPEHDWVSMSVISDGSYGVTPGLVFSFPVRCRQGRFEIVRGIELNDFSLDRIRLSEQELLAERDMVAHLLPH